MYLLGTSTQIYTIANLKIPVLYMVALSELKLNENSKHDEVAMYQNQAVTRGGVRGAFAPPPPQAPKVHILILNVIAKEYSRLN